MPQRGGCYGAERGQGCTALCWSQGTVWKPLLDSCWSPLKVGVGMTGQWDRFEQPLRSLLLWWHEEPLHSGVRVPGILLCPWQGEPCKWTCGGSPPHPFVQACCQFSHTRSCFQNPYSCFCLGNRVLKNIPAVGTRFELYLLSPVVPLWLLGRSSPANFLLVQPPGPFWSQEEGLVVSKSVEMLGVKKK